jgi:acyl phosphate:glycerol-3-phosphate acyltransferase
MRDIVVLVFAYLLGAVPFSNLFARRLRGVDLRDTGSGTVSGTGLYRVAGFGPLAVAGVLDVAKGAVAVLVAGPGRPALAALAGGMAVIGHNWSLFLRGAGGRGLAPSMGTLLVQAWVGVVVILAGLAAGRAREQSGLGSFVALLLVVPSLAVTGGRYDALAGACAVTPVLVKRVTGNEPTSDWSVRVHRLVYDNDGPSVA